MSGRTDPAKAGRGRKALITAIVAAVALIIGIAAIAWSNSRDDNGSASNTPAGPSSDASQPGGATAAGAAALTESGAIRLAEGDAVADPNATVTIYVDYRCPHCKEFDELFGSAITEIAASGTAAVDYVPVAILDSASTTQYSTRAANASYCVARHSGEAWAAFNQAVFDAQPTDRGAGLSNADLARIAAENGASEQAQSCIIDEAEAGQVAAGLDRAVADQLEGTPTVLINGEKQDLTSPDALVEAALSAAQ
jgi:protein-disulfide isomerase